MHDKLMINRQSNRWIFKVRQFIKSNRSLASDFKFFIMLELEQRGVDYTLSGEQIGLTQLNNLSLKWLQEKGYQDLNPDVITKGQERLTFNSRSNLSSVQSIESWNLEAFNEFLT